MTTATLTLAEFLLARIAEDEAAARAGFSSQADPENGWGYGGYGSPTALTPHVGIIHEAVQAAHIIRWQPARVLADCKAKRQIVERFARAESERWTRGYVHGTAASLKDVLCDLALPYASHPDFRPEWRA